MSSSPTGATQPVSPIRRPPSWDTKDRDRKRPRHVDPYPFSGESVAATDVPKALRVHAGPTSRGLNKEVPMTSPYISSRLAEQRIQELLRQADQGRLRRVAREQPRAQRPARP